MYFEDTGHLGGVTDDDIQSITMTLPKLQVYSEDVILNDPFQISGFGFQGTCRSKKVTDTIILILNQIIF